MNGELAVNWGDPAVIGALAGAGVFVLVLAFGVARSVRVAGGERRETMELISRFSGGVAREQQRESKPSEPESLWARIAGIFVTSGQSRRMDRLLAYAGRQGSESVQFLAARKLQGTVLGFLVGMLIGLWFGGASWVIVPVLTVLGFAWPDLMLRREAKKRNEELLLALPEALDLLNLCVGAGLGLQGALQQVARNQRGPVAAEFTRVLQEMSLGVPRADAFMSMAKRVQQQDVLRFVYALVQVDRLGIPLSAVMNEQAKEMRARRQSRAREAAQQVSVKILLPLVVCFLPGLFVVIVGPALISIWELLTS